MTAQFRSVMKLLTTKLAAADATWTDVAFRRIYTTDVDACLRAERDPEVLGYLDPDLKPAIPSSASRRTAIRSPDFSRSRRPVSPPLASWRRQSSFWTR